MEYFDRLPKIAGRARSRALRFEQQAHGANREIVRRLARARAWIEVAVHVADRNMELIKSLEDKRAQDLNRQAAILDNTSAELEKVQQDELAPGAETETDRLKRGEALVAYAESVRRYQQTLLHMQEGTQALQRAMLDKHYSSLDELLTTEDHEKLARVGKEITGHLRGTFFSVAALILFGPLAQPVIIAGREVLLTLRELKEAYQKDVEAEDVKGASDLYNRLDDFELAIATWTIATVIFSRGSELVLAGGNNAKALEQFSELVCSQEAADVILESLVEELPSFMAPLIKAEGA